MAEAPDLLGLVEGGSSRLHPPDGLHLVVVVKGLLLGQGTGRDGTVVQFVQFEVLKQLM